MVDPELHTLLLILVGFGIYCLGIKKGEKLGLVNGYNAAVAEGAKRS